MADRALVVQDTASRRPRTVVVALHLAVLAAIVLTSGAVREAPPPEGSRYVNIPGELHRYSECCSGSTDPSMEAY